MLVRDARLSKVLTLRQAAGLAGLSRSALGNIETTTYPPGPAVATRLINSFELPHDRDFAPFRSSSDGDGP